MEGKLKNEIKLTFLGDITCDRPMLTAARQKDGSFDFNRSLYPLKGILGDSDYVVGNFETVCAGEKPGYNPGAVTYNSPDALPEALRKVGIDMVTMANNHCLDCGGAGLERTMQLLDDLGIGYTGTWRANEPIKKRYWIQEISGIKVAFVAFTDCLNNRANGTAHSEKEWCMVNQLRSYKASLSGNKLKELLKTILPMEKIREIKAEKSRANGVKLVKVRIDNEDIAMSDRPRIQWAIELLKAARKESDFVVACIHCGGQFNAEPGTHSVQLYDMLEPYADAIVGNHPHVVQKMNVNDGKVRAYSLGSLNISPSADYVTHDFAPDYSVSLNLYIKKNNNGKVALNRVSFSLLHAEEDENMYVTVYPIKGNQDNVEEQEKEKMRMVFKRFSGKEFQNIADEYFI